MTDVSLYSLTFWDLLISQLDSHCPYMMLPNWNLSLYLYNM